MKYRKSKLLPLAVFVLLLVVSGIAATIKKDEARESKTVESKQSIQTTTVPQKGTVESAPQKGTLDPVPQKGNFEPVIEKIPEQIVVPFLVTPQEVKSATGMEILWQVLSSGGSRSSSTNFSHEGTTGQTAIGSASSPSFSVSHGYWLESGENPPSYICGDANSDEGVNVGDAVYLINYVFKGGPAPDPLEAGDANCDGGVNVGDAVYLINYVFKGGPAPCASCS